MNQDMQQIIISGLGGQGVLFVTRLLADTALQMDYSVLISETHGMAQRGGNVISHLKVARKEAKESLISPLIRPGRADILLALHSEAMKVHGHFLRTDGVSFSDCGEPSEKLHIIDASRIATELNSPVSANLVLLGFAATSGELFCGPEQVEEVLAGYGGKRLEMSLKAFRAGCGRS